MALFECNFHSAVLELSQSVTVIIPQDVKENEKVKALYLLHGYIGNHTDWMRYTSLERYVQSHRIAVIMPAVNNSYYTDMVSGLNYFTYVTEELPKLISSTFPVSTKKEDQYVCGLSMGGYGALKIALTYPERYHKAASLSGAVDLEHIRELASQNKRFDFFLATFGKQTTKETKNDINELIKQAKAKKAVLPELYIACGTEDFLYQDNQKFISFLKEENVKFTYEESKGDHNWEFWDFYIRKVLHWMFKA